MPSQEKQVSIQVLVSHYSCCDCNYEWCKMGEANMKMVKMIKRMHEKKCRKTGRTENSRSTGDLLEQQDRQQGLTAINPTSHSQWENENQFTEPGMRMESNNTRVMPSAQRYATR